MQALRSPTLTRISRVLVPVAMAAFATFVIARPVYADLIIAGGNNPQLDENVLFNTGLSGNPIFGTTNQTGLSVVFDSNELLLAPSNGQARVEGADGTLTQLSISLLTGTFTSLILDIDAATDGFVSFTANQVSGPALIAPFALGASGSNFFTITATNGQRLTNVMFTSDVNVTDVAQVRVGSAAVAPLIVPEPASMLLFGVGISGGVRRWRQRR